MKKYTVRKQKSGSGMFLMEMIVAVFFFIICASVCILAFSKADHMSRRAKNLNQAVLAAESTAEVFNQSGTDGLLTGMHFQEKDAEQAGEVSWYAAYDREWKLCSYDGLETAFDGFFVIVTAPEHYENGLQTIHIEVRMAKPAGADDPVLYELDTARYER